MEYISEKAHEFKNKNKKEVNPGYTWLEKINIDGQKLKDNTTITDILQEERGTSLVVQWLRLQAPNAGGLDCIPGQGTRACMFHLKIPHAAAMTLYGHGHIKKKTEKSWNRNTFESKIMRLTVS